MQEGIYSINTYVNIDAGLDVAYFSKDYGARLIIGGISGTNNQLFQFTPKGSGWQIRGCDSSNMLDSSGQDLIFPGTDNVKYQQILMFWDSQSGGQIWYVEDVAGQTVDINGESLQVVRIKNGSGKYLCCPGGGISSANNLNWAIVKDNDSEDITEWWVLRKSAYKVDGAVPADLKVSSVYGGVEAPWITGRGEYDMYPSFICPADHRYQIRWRWRGRIAGTNSFTGWSAWKSPSGAITDDGWGNVWEPNDIIGPIPRGRRYGTPIKATCAVDTYDKREYNYEVRIGGTGTVAGRLGIQYGSSRNDSAAVTIPAYYQPIFKVTGCTMTPEGLEVSYTSDYPRNNNTVRIGPIYVGGRAITQWNEFAGQAYEGSVCIPPSKLAFVPSKGATWTAQAYLVPDYGISFFYDSHTGTIAYSTGFSSAITPPTVSDGDGAEVLVTFGASSAGHSVTLVYQEGKQDVSVACEQVSSTVFSVLPPAGKEFDIIWSTTGSGTTWATGTIHHDAIEFSNYIWSFDGTYVQAYLFDNSTADAPHGVTRDYDSEITQGRKFETVFFGRGSKGKISIDCVVPINADPKYPNATIEDMRLLLASEYAVFRTPDGQRHDVAITGMDDSRVFSGLYSVSVDMVECDNQ